MIRQHLYLMAWIVDKDAPLVKLALCFGGMSKFELISGDTKTRITKWPLV